MSAPPPKHMSGHNLPEDLWPSILSRLPVKSLLRFRSVSKQWRSLIADPAFARLHLHLYTNNRLQTHLIFYPLEKTLMPLRLELRSTESFKITSRPHIPEALLDKRLQSGNWHVVSSIEGLFVLRISKSLVPELMIWNPATRETLTLPPSPEAPIGKSHAVDFGLAYDPSIKSYKHLRLIQKASGSRRICSISLFSLPTNSWKTIPHEPVLIQRIEHLDDSAFCQNGVLYRLASINDSIHRVKHLVSFDLRSERLAAISLPEDEVDLYSRGPPGLTMADEGRSVAVVLCTLGSGSVWVLEEFETASWSKRYTFSSMIAELDRFYEGYFYCLIKNGEVLIAWDSMLTSYDLVTKKEKVAMKDEIVRKGLPFIENLVAFPKVD